MGYFLQKLAEEAESKRTAKNTITGGAAGALGGAAIGAGALGAAYGGRKLYDIAAHKMSDRASRLMDEGQRRIRTENWKDFDQIRKDIAQGRTKNKAAKEWLKLTEGAKKWGGRASRSEASLAQHLKNIKGAGKYAIPATALAGLVGGAYGLGKD